MYVVVVFSWYFALDQLCRSHFISSSFQELFFFLYFNVGFKSGYKLDDVFCKGIDISFW